MESLRSLATDPSPSPAAFSSGVMTTAQRQKKEEKKTAEPRTNKELAGSTDTHRRLAAL